MELRVLERRRLRSAGLRLRVRPSTRRPQPRRKEAQTGLREPNRRRFVAFLCIGRTPRRLTVAREKERSDAIAHASAAEPPHPRRRPAAQTVLTDEMLARFAKRAPQYDRENVFFSDDFEELQEAGYLRLAVPTELGGAGLSLAGVAQQQRRLGYYAAPTALAINMHLYWTGVAADLWRAGDTSLRWLLEEAAAGEVFAAGHAESGNDIPVLLSTTKARTRRRRLPVHGPQVVRQPVAGVDLSRAFTGWTPPIRPSRRSSTPSCRAIPKATASSRRGTCSACARRAATTRFSTAPSCPIATSPGSCRPGAAGIDHFVLGALRLGAARLRQHLLRARAAGARPDDRGGEVEALDRALTRPMAYHAELQHRVARDGAGVRGDRAASRSRRRRLVERRRSRRAPGRRRSSRRSTTRSKTRGASSIWRSRWRAGSASSAAAGSNSSSAMRVSAASTRPTRC